MVIIDSPERLPLIHMIGYLLFSSQPCEVNIKRVTEGLKKYFTHSSARASGHSQEGTVANQKQASCIIRFDWRQSFK